MIERERERTRERERGWEKEDTDREIWHSSINTTIMAYTIVLTQVDKSAREIS